MSFSVILRDWLLEPIMKELGKVEKIMENDKVALDEAIKSLGDLILAEDKGIQVIVKAVTDLVAKIQASPSADFSNEITAIQAMASDIQLQTQTIASAISVAAPQI